MVVQQLQKETFIKKNTKYSALKSHIIKFTFDLMSAKVHRKLIW